MKNFTKLKTYLIIYEGKRVCVNVSKLKSVKIYIERKSWGETLKVEGVDDKYSGIKWTFSLINLAKMKRVK